MNCRYFTPLLFLVGGLWASPSFAETSIGSLSSSEPEQVANVRQLLTTNVCSYCDLTGVDLSQAHLIGADLRGAKLSGATLTEANLEGADLTGADLTGADLAGAFLTNATMNLTVLNNVDFSGAQLYFVEVGGASVDNLNLANATVVGTPISVGGAIGHNSVPIYDGAESLTEEELPVLTPDDIWPPTP
ncbi:MAG: pentapeptide repeat-containing protein [Cyanobacteria bacterium P01_F01_bin.150]